MREVSIEEPSGEGKGERSRRVRRVSWKRGRWERERAVDRPKTPEPRMRIFEGGEEKVGGICNGRKEEGGHEMEGY